MKVVAVASVALVLLAGCTRARPAPALQAAGQPSGDLATRWLAPDVERAAKNGAGPAMVLAFGAGAPGDTIGGRLSIGAGECVLFLARGSRSIEDLDLFVYGDDGALLGGDETASENASAVVCPEHPDRIYAFARVAAGRGVMALAAESVKPENAERVARAVGAAGKLREQPVAGGWPGLDELLAAHRKALGGAWKDERRVAVPLDPRVPTRTSLVVEAGRCADVLVLPSDDVAFVELTALDAEGRIVGRSTSEERLPSLRACSLARAELTLELRPHAGRGLAAIVLSSTADTKAVATLPGTFILDVPSGDPKDAAALEHELAVAGYAAKVIVTRGATGVGRRVSAPVDVPNGCSRIDVVASEPSRGIEGWLWDGNGALVAHDDGGARATLFACGRDLHARLDVEAIARPGPYTVELRAAPGAAPLFAQHPLAAGRLMGRLSDARRLTTVKSFPPPRLVSLSSSKIVTDDQDVAPGQCVDIAVGLGIGAEGIEIRVMDAEANVELALTRGTYSALADACALDRSHPLKLRLELRVGAGTGDALLVKQLRTTPRPP